MGPYKLYIGESSELTDASISCWIMSIIINTIPLSGNPILLMNGFHICWRHLVREWLITVYFRKPFQSSNQMLSNIQYPGINQGGTVKRLSAKCHWTSQLTRITPVDIDAWSLLPYPHFGAWKYDCICKFLNIKTNYYFVVDTIEYMWLWNISGYR